MAEDRGVKKYFENIPYGNDSLASEIHGPRNQETINNIVSSLVRNYDKHIAEGNKQMAGHFNSQIKKMAQQLEGLKAIKEEFAMNYGSGKGGKSMFSNYTDLSWDRAFFTENGVIQIDQDMKLALSVVDDVGVETKKNVEDITENWVIKGTEEADFMRLQQSAVEQRNTMSNPLDYDVDWEISKLLENTDSWKVLACDKIGGRYFLNDYIEENQEDVESGAIPDNMLHPDSFNPDFDARLHTYYTNRIRRAFDENYQTPAEARRADELIARGEQDPQANPKSDIGFRYGPRLPENKDKQNAPKPLTT